MRADYLAEIEAMVSQEWNHLGEKVAADETEIAWE